MAGSAALLDHRYQVYSLLSAGDHERRYTGRHVELDLPVRITALRPTSADDDVTTVDALRFWTLAQQAASLRHPALPRLRDCFRAGGGYVLIEDAVAGETLAERIERQGCLSLRDTLAMGLRLCDALSHAAQVCAGLIPLLTITPQTIVFLPTAQVVLTELGSWRWLGLGCPPEPQAVPYCAPEVAGSVSVDARADVYSVAAVMYRALTGRVPTARSQEGYPLAVEEPAIPPTLGSVLEHALAADPALRYVSAEHLGRACAMAARVVLPDAALTAPAAKRRRPKPAVTPATPGDEDRDVAPKASPRAQPVLLSGPAQIASELVHFPLPPVLRRALGHNGAATDSAIHSRA